MNASCFFKFENPSQTHPHNALLSPAWGEALCGLRGGRGQGRGRCHRKDQKVTGTQRLAKRELVAWFLDCPGREILQRRHGGPVERGTNKQLHGTLGAFPLPPGPQGARLGESSLFLQGLLCAGHCARQEPSVDTDPSTSPWPRATLTVGATLGRPPQGFSASRDWRPGARQSWRGGLSAAGCSAAPEAGGISRRPLISSCDNKNNVSRVCQMPPGGQVHPRLQTAGLPGLDMSYVSSLITSRTRGHDVHFTEEESEAERAGAGDSPRVAEPGVRLVFSILNLENQLMKTRAQTGLQADPGLAVKYRLDLFFFDGCGPLRRGAGVSLSF